MVIVVFQCYSESPESPDFFPEYPDFPENRGLTRTFRTFKHQISFASLLSVWTVISISLLCIAHHKHPISVILSCFSFCAKFGPKRTIDIQNQYAHIKGEYYKRSLIFLGYLLWDLFVLSSITKKGEIEGYLGSLRACLGNGGFKWMEEYWRGFWKILSYNGNFSTSMPFIPLHSTNSQTSPKWVLVI
jgi:hypothetical protein